MVEGFTASKNEHITYSLFFLGQNFLWGFAAYIATYLTDIGFSAAAAAGLLAAPKIWDAVNDILFGYIVDRAPLKSGQRFLPWIRIGLSGIGLTCILMFSIPPSMTLSAKAAWFILAYVLFDFFYTLLDAPAFALPTVMTSSIKERTSLLSGCKFFGMTGGALATVLISLIRSSFGWSRSALFFAGIGSLLMIPLVFFVKERSGYENKEKKERYTAKQLFTYLRANRYLALILICFFLLGISSVESIMSLYIARSCFGSETYAILITAAASLPVLVVAALIPVLSRRYDKFRILIGGLIFSVLISIITYFTGYSNPLTATIMIGLKCSGMAFWEVVIYMLISDTTEYGWYKTGIHAAGMTFSLQTFVSKLRTALKNSFLLALLAMIGFVEGEGVVQSASVTQGIWAIFVLVPIAGYMIAVILLGAFYHLRDHSVQDMARYNRGEMSYEEAEEKLIPLFGKPAVKRGKQVL